LRKFQVSSRTILANEMRDYQEVAMKSDEHFFGAREKPSLKGALPVLRFNAEIQRLESLNVETVTQNVNFI
jgi:hypothetical protein